MAEQAGGMTLYHGRPVEAALAGWLLVAIGGLVCLPLGLAHRALWLVLLAPPPLIVGLALLQVRLRVELDPPRGLIRVTRLFLGLRLTARAHPLSDCQGLELVRVAGDARERPTDTWYLRLRLRTARYTLGRYADRESALAARRTLAERLRVGAAAHLPPWPPVEVQDQAPAEVRSAQAHYREGLVAMRAGDREAARRAFERARESARDPLLRRMSEQRLRELERR